MRVTVILCTCNRAGQLRCALESLAHSEVSTEIDWEVLVVDNNSSDQTPEIVGNFSERYPGRFRYLLERTQGKSHALNSGIRASQGDVLAFTDDDVTVQPTWLQNLTASLHDKKWAGAGGRTLPDRNFVPTKWLPKDNHHALAPLAIFDRDSAACELKETPFGNNMAYRKDIFEKYGGFRTDLGPRPGGGPQKNEDSEFGNRILAAGEHLRYEPSAVLYHAVPASRLSQAHFLSWWFDKARADVYTSGVPNPAGWSIAGVPLSLFLSIAKWSLRWIFSMRPDVRFSCKINLWVKLGQCKECYLLWREAAHKAGRPSSRLDSGSSSSGSSL